MSRPSMSCFLYYGKELVDQAHAHVHACANSYAAVHQSCYLSTKPVEYSCRITYKTSRKKCQNHLCVPLLMPETCISSSFSFVMHPRLRRIRSCCSVMMMMMSMNSSKINKNPRDREKKKIGNRLLLWIKVACYGLMIILCLMADKLKPSLQVYAISGFYVLIVGMAVLQLVSQLYKSSSSSSTQRLQGTKEDATGEKEERGAYDLPKTDWQKEAIRWKQEARMLFDELKAKENGGLNRVERFREQYREEIKNMMWAEEANQIKLREKELYMEELKKQLASFSEFTEKFDYLEENLEKERKIGDQFVKRVRGLEKKKRQMEEELKGVKQVYNQLVGDYELLRRKVYVTERGTGVMLKEGTYERGNVEADEKIAAEMDITEQDSMGGKKQVDVDTRKTQPVEETKLMVKEIGSLDAKSQAYEIGCSYMMQGKAKLGSSEGEHYLKMAESSFQQVLEFDERDDLSRLNIGLCLSLRAGQMEGLDRVRYYERACEEYRIVAGRNPSKTLWFNYGLALYSRAVCLENDGVYDGAARDDEIVFSYREALTRFMKAMVLDPSNEKIRYYVGECTKAIEARGYST